jgi:hypothetical protein
MSSDKCSSCGAPSSPSALACSFCGTVLRTPQTVDDELTLLREQALAFQKKSGSLGGIGALLPAGILPGNRTFWQSAFVPQTVPGLRLALDQCASFAPSDFNSRELAAVFLARAEGLKMALCNHREATAADMAAATQVVDLLMARRKRGLMRYFLLAAAAVAGLVTLLWLSKAGILPR